MFRVIICTLSTSSYLISAGGLRGFFTYAANVPNSPVTCLFRHIFVDEAGQATEPESWIPIGGLADTNTKIVLAGDPKQLGPVVQLNLSKKYGFGRSMLSRLMSMDCYQTNNRLMVMLQVCQEKWPFLLTDMP